MRSAKPVVTRVSKQQLFESNSSSNVHPKIVGIIGGEKHGHSDSRKRRYSLPKKTKINQVQSLEQVNASLAVGVDEKSSSSAQRPMSGFSLMRLTQWKRSSFRKHGDQTNQRFSMGSLLGTTEARSNKRKNRQTFLITQRCCCCLITAVFGSILLATIAAVIGIFMTEQTTAQSTFTTTTVTITSATTETTTSATSTTSTS
ncbi:unnamed protein product, partial [Rotaria magnacalcarata]